MCTRKGANCSSDGSGKFWVTVTCTRPLLTRALAHRCARAFPGPEFRWTPPAPVSSTESPGFQIIKKSVAACFGAPTAPMLMIGNTDTRHYWGLSDKIFRFSVRASEQGVMSGDPACCIVKGPIDR